LVLGTDGYFYGTTSGGGKGLGTIFKTTPKGQLTTLYNFCSLTNCVDGSSSFGLIQGTDGNFYGTTVYGGNDSNTLCNGVQFEGCGTIFSITSAGVFTTLYSFCPGTACSDGSGPFAELMQSTNGEFYGTTGGGGAPSSTCSSPYGCGTVYSLATGLKPFVKTLPTSGTVGAPIRILGNNLTGATSVTFNGTQATFTVMSSTLIATTVPTGATTGKIRVTLPGGTLVSNIRFYVVP